MNYECVVIGGGAAGMMAAIAAAKGGKKTAIIEHTDRVGKKILQTGNGRCNITNLHLDENCYNNDDKAFVMNVISKFNVQDTIEFFKGLGIYPKSRNGYIYPNSDMAAAVLDALRLEVEHQNVQVLLETNVASIKQNKNETLSIKTDKGIIEADKIIIATGSMAAPKTGSDGSGYTLAKQIGHRIVKPLPALVQLKSNSNTCKTMAGVRSEGNVQLFVNDKCVASDLGEVQYTDYGISGIPVFQISRYAVRAVDAGEKVHIIIDMLPNISKEDLTKLIFDRLTGSGYKNVEQFLSGMLNKKLIGGICKANNIKITDNMNSLNKKDILSIIDIIKAFKMNINGFNSFENGQICSGGVDLSEVNPDTMESKKMKNVFFAGEILDVDGICGGYNLQWAWSSGHVAGMECK